MPDFVRSGSGQHYASTADLEFRLEQARAEIHVLSRQLVKHRVILHRLVDELSVERAAQLRLEMENARS